MRAVILAGGKGTRLAPYTTVFPKPLVPVGDMPILEIVVRQLHRAGVDHITMAVGHLANLLMAFLRHAKMQAGSPGHCLQTFLVIAISCGADRFIQS